MRFFLLDADYIVRGGDPVVRLYGKDGKGNDVVIEDRSFLPYFYVIPSTNPEELRKKILSTRFYTPSGDELVVRDVEIVERDYGPATGRILRVVAGTPQMVPHLKECIMQLEGVEGAREFDILFYRRYLFDSDIACFSWNDVVVERDGEALVLKRVDSSSVHPSGTDSVLCASLDLETMPTEGGGQEILVAGLAFSDGERVAITWKPVSHEKATVVESERELIQKLVDVIREKKPGIIFTFNGDSFDFPVLEDRAKLLDVDLSGLSLDGKGFSRQRAGFRSALCIRGRPHIDLYQFVFRIMRANIDADDLTLGSVARAFLGRDKLEMDFEEFFEAWRNGEDFSRAIEYNLRDVDLTLELGMILLGNIGALSRLTNQPVFDICRATFGQLVERYAMRRASSMGVVVPNRPSSEVVSERFEGEAYEGALVLEPEPGLHENILVFDFKSLYPTIIVSHNIDPYTVNVPGCPEDKRVVVPEVGHYVCTLRRGFIPTILEDLIKERQEIKKKMKSLDPETPEFLAMDKEQWALKTLANSFYGFLGFAGSRWYKRECAESVTAFGRHYIKMVVEIAREMGLEPIYGDTDSVFVRIKPGEDPDRVARRFLERVNPSLPGIMELEYEGFYVRGIFVPKTSGEGGAKKKYALLSSDGKIVVKGFERVRRDWCALAREIQEGVIERVLKGRVDDAIALVRETVKALKEGRVPKKKLVIYTQLTKDPEKYAQDAPHVAAARRAREAGIKISPGSVIPYVIVKGSGSISDRAFIESMAKDYDPSYYIDHQVVPAALRVLGVLGVTKERLLGMPEQKGLLGFIGKK